MDLSDQNVFCQEVKITSGVLFKAQPFPKFSTLKKGLILELLKIKNLNGMSWPVYKGWIENMINDSEPIPLNALRKSVLNIEEQRAKMMKNVHRVGRSKMEEFLHECYKLPGRLCVPDPVDDGMAREITTLKEKVAAGQQQLLLMEKKIQEVKSNSHNIRRKLKRREDKISKLLSIPMEIKHTNKRTKSLSNLVRYYKAKCRYLNNKLQTFECTECNELDISVRNLKQENIELREKNALLIDELKDSKKINFYYDRKYCDNLRICIMELLTYNVSILKIEPVLRSVFKLLNIECNKLPQRTAINEILIESRSIAHTQIAETLITSSNNTLHSDGTTKFGHKYQSYQVSTEEGSLTLGLQVRTLVDHNHLVVVKH